MSSFKTKITQLPYTGLRSVLAAVFICAMAAQLSAGMATIIRIRAQVEIVGPEVLLGNIAAIEGGDVRRVQHLKDIVIGKAPPPGDSRRFGRPYVIHRLRQHHIDPATVVLEVPPQVEVIRSHVKIHQQEIEKIVSDFILERAPRGDKTLRIKEIRAPQSVILPKGRITYKVSAPRSRQLMGQCPIAVNFSVDGQVQKKVWATAEIAVLGPVVVTRKPLGRFNPITEEDITVQNLDLADLPSNVVCDPDAVIGKRTKRAIGSQTPVRADFIELPPLVRRGDLVVIVAESENLKITTLGKVKKKGRLGEQIPVVNLDSKKILHARVVDANTVQVDF